MALVGVAVVALGLFGFDSDQIKSIAELVSGMVVVMCYVLSEASIDKAAINAMTQGADDPVEIIGASE